MTTATAERETEHQASIGSITGATVAGVGAGVGTAAVGTKIANGSLTFGKAKEAVTNLAKDGAEKAKDLATNVTDAAKSAGTNLQNAAQNVVESSPTQSVDGAAEAATDATAKVAETGKGLVGKIREKAGDCLKSLQGHAGELKDGFKALLPTQKGLVLIGSSLAALAVAKVAHDKLSAQPANDNHYINPQTAQVANVSQGVARGQTSELDIPTANQR